MLVSLAGPTPQRTVFFYLKSLEKSESALVLTNWETEVGG